MMKKLALTLLFGILGVGVYGQTIKTLGYNTTNGVVAYSGTNTLTFTNGTRWNGQLSSSDLGADNLTIEGAIYFTDAVDTNGIAITRTNLGLGATWLTNTNVTNFRTAIGLGSTDNVILNEVQATFFVVADETNSQISFEGNSASTTRTNLGLGWSALTNTNAATSLLGFITNGQVVANTGTNALTFTNRVSQSSTNATNPPELRLTTKSNNVASWFVYDAVQTNPAAPNWAVAWYGLNTAPNATGTDRSRVNESIGAASITIENMWMSPAPEPDAPLAEFYFNITDTNNLTTRGFSVIGNQTNSTIGFADFVYPVTIYYNSNSRSWYGNDYLGLNVVSTNTGELATFTHSSTNPNATAQVYLKVQNNQTIWQAGLTHTVLRNFGAGRNAFRVETNGVIYGATGANDSPQAPVHLAGNTRIDGAISFNATTNADITRTNLGLGGGITTNRTFVSYDGTNYTTNSVTISNGIITGWSQ
jgi:hypothetical protein